MDKIAKIRMLILDVDGVLTDGGLYYTERGDEFKRFNAKDGLALVRARRKGLRLGIISNSTNEGIIGARAQKLGIEHIYVGERPKIEVIHEWMQTLNISLEEIAYIGDDLNDYYILQAVGLSMCPADAVWQLHQLVDVRLLRKGGDACVREAIETVLGIELMN